MKNRNIWLMMLLLLIFSCTINTVNIDDRESIALSKKVVNNFYNEMKVKNYEGTTPLLADTLLKTIDKQSLFVFYDTYFQKCGEILDVKLVSCNTRLENSNGIKKLKAIVIYNVKRGKLNTKERFLLKAVNNTPLKIQRYDIDDKL